eukprot:scaffold14373_cov27-Phaeocystis_antarctica.AAC.3
MGFTTKLGLHSQTTRLCESMPWRDLHLADGALTLYSVPFQETWARPVSGSASIDYNSPAKGWRFSSWAFPSSLAVTKGILVSFFSSAY